MKYEKKVDNVEEIKEKRDQSTKHFSKEDGTYEAMVYEKPEQYRCSSYNIYIGEKNDNFINSDTVLKYF